MVLRVKIFQHITGVTTPQALRFQGGTGINIEGNILAATAGITFQSFTNVFAGDTCQQGLNHEQVMVL